MADVILFRTIDALNYVCDWMTETRQRVKSDLQKNWVTSGKFEIPCAYFARF